MKKRLLAMALALAMTAALAACGSEKREEPTEEPPAVLEDAGTPDTADTPEEAPPETEGPEHLPTDDVSQPELGVRPADPDREPVYKPLQKPADKPAQTPAAPEKSVDLAAFCTALTENGEEWPSMAQAEGEALEALYAGLQDISTEQSLVYMAAITVSSVELALVEVSDSADVQAVKDIFQARVDYQAGADGAPGGAWYPAATEMWKNNSRIVSNGNFVMLVAHDAADAAVDSFNALFV